MRTLLLATVAVLGVAGIAHAGEGNGDPFPSSFAGVTTKVAPGSVVSRDNDPYQYRIGGSAARMDNYRPMASASQDPFPYRAAARVITMAPNETATASVGSVGSVAQGVASPHS